jgi:hypothetical protein
MEGRDIALTTKQCARLAHKRGYFQTSDDEDGARGGTSSKGESKSKGKGESKGKTKDMAAQLAIDRRPSGKILRYDGGKGQHKTKGESSEGDGKSKGCLSRVPLIRPHEVQGYSDGYREGYGSGYSAGYLTGYDKGCRLL